MTGMGTRSPLYIRPSSIRLDWVHGGGATVDDLGGVTSFSSLRLPLFPSSLRAASAVERLLCGPELGTPLSVALHILHESGVRLWCPSDGA